MSSEVDHTSVVESHKIKMSSTNTSSGMSTTGPKVSIFASKSRFVIPKNKVLGSFNPVFKGGKKPGGNDANEESTNNIVRKSRWGPDPTQDAAVKRGRALAYQTRVDQITKRLKSGITESGETGDSQVADQHADPKLSSGKIDSKDLELLKLEWREIIGEILKLNPSYKAPPEYEPLLKDATVPIPVKDHPGCNFVGLICGPGGETQKRLEKETGAKIQVCGTKANTGEKVEISSSDGSDTQAAYEELSVHVSADTFEKVDGAIGLIELLVTSVSGNLAAGNNMNVQSQEVSTPSVVPINDHGVGQSVVGHAHTPQHGQFQYHGLQFPAFLAQAPGHRPSFTPIQNSSAPTHSNTLPAQSSPLSATIMSSLFGPRPILGSGLNSVLQNTSLVQSRPQLPMQVSPHPFPPRNFPLSTPQLSSSQANILASLPFSGPTLLSPVAGPLASSVPQPVSGVPSGPQSERPLIPVGSSSGWSVAPIGVPASVGSTGQMVPPMIPFQGPQPLVPQSGFLSSTPPSNMPVANVVSSASFPSGPSTINVPVNHPTGTPSFASVPPQMGSSSMPIPIQTSPASLSPLPQASMNPIPGTMPISSPVVSMSQPTPQFGIMGSRHAVNPTPTRPPITDPKLLHSGPSDFTFQRHLSNPAIRAAAQDTRFPRSPMIPSSPQAPSFRSAVPNSIPSPSMHSLPRPQMGNQMAQTQVHMPLVPFARNSAGIPHIVPVFSNASPAPRMPNWAGPPSRLANPLQVQPTYPAPTIPRGNFMAPKQPSGKNLPFASGSGQQIYDPFSPSSVPQHQGGNLERKPEIDTEYEDLMTSVGVK